MDELRREFGLTEPDVAAIRAYVPPFNFDNIDRVHPGTILEAQLSLHYALAHVLVHGHLSPRDFSPGKLADPGLNGLQSRMTVSVDPALGGTGARVEVDLRDGRSLTRTVAESRGDPGNPFTVDQLRDKFRDNAVTVLSGRDAEDLFERVMFGSGDRPVRDIVASFAAVGPGSEKVNA
jgi:2-methylcitrate dehydratase PrpD